MADRKGLSITEAINAAAAHADVTRALASRAGQVLNRARYEAYKAGRVNFGDALRVEAGTRSGAKSPHGIKRPYARVIAAITPEQHEADSRKAKASRTEILRRSAR